MRWRKLGHLFAPDGTLPWMRTHAANPFGVRLDASRMRIFFVVPDYFERRPKPCMNGWGSVFLNVAPDGTALPCHAARMLPGLAFPNVKDEGLESIW